jgi:hypothetical protein
LYNIKRKKCKTVCAELTFAKVTFWQNCHDFYRICIFFSLFAMQFDYYSIQCLVKGRHSHCLYAHKLYSNAWKCGKTVAKCMPYLQYFQVLEYLFNIFKLNNAIYMLGVPIIYYTHHVVLFILKKKYLKQKIWVISEYKKNMWNHGKP